MRTSRLLFVFVTSMFFTGLASGQTFYVNNCGHDGWCNGQSAACWNGNALNQTCAKKTIQAGIESTTANGQTVIVADGTYTGTGNKDLIFWPWATNDPRLINLRSANGAHRCVIDLENAGRAFNFDHAWVDGALNRQAIIGTPTDSCGVQFGKGFTVVNGNWQGDFGGGAIIISDTDPTIRDCVFRNNRTPYRGGAAFVMKNANPLFDGCRFVSNMAGGDGGAMAAVINENTKVRGDIRNCHFLLKATEDTGDGRGGAIFAEGNENTIISRTIIERNKCRMGAGGVHIEGTSYLGTVKLANCVIVNNNVDLQSPPNGGGIRINGPSSGRPIQPEFMNCLIVGNLAQSGGGAYISGRTQMRMVNSTIAYNSVLSSLGGEAIWFDGVNLGVSSRSIVANSILWNDPADGSLVRVSGQGLRIEESDVRGTLPGQIESSDNISADPQFANPYGFDGIIGTVDDDFRTYNSNSPTVDNGDTALLLSDFSDLNGLNGTAEPTPLDLDRLPRNQGLRVDMGPYELGGCPRGEMMTISPGAPNGTRDSRRPHPLDDCSLAAREGIGDPTDPLPSDTIRLSITDGGMPVYGATRLGCWSLCETGIEDADLTSGCERLDENGIQTVIETCPGIYEVRLRRPISGGYWTRITYSGGSNCVVYSSLPADANADGTSSPADILRHLDCCINHVCTPPYGEYSCDINRDGVVTCPNPTSCPDANALYELLDGKEKFIQWNGEKLESNSCACGAGG